jgi:hypothetical protein
MVQLSYVLRRAWKITWRHKALWLFGLLVSLGTVGTRAGVGSGSRWEQSTRALPPEVRRAIADFLSSPYFTVAVVALALLALTIGVGLALLSALGRAALVDQVRAAEERGLVDVRTGWQAGRRYFWPVFLLRLLLGLPVAVVTLIGVLLVVGTWLLTGGREQPEALMSSFFIPLLTLVACLLPAICLAVLLSIPLSVLQRLAVRACVLEGHSVRQSIVRAWAMLWQHLGRLTLVWLILAGVGIGVMIVIGLPLALVALSLAAAALLTMFISPLLSIVLGLIIGLAVWLLGATFNSVVETFTSAVWTLAYRELTGLGLTGE